MFGHTCPGHEQGGSRGREKDGARQALPAFAASYAGAPWTRSQAWTQDRPCRAPQAPYTEDGVGSARPPAVARSLTTAGKRSLDRTTVRAHPNLMIGRSGVHGSNRRRPGNDVTSTPTT